VGANDGYFCFGCAAAFRRLGIKGTIVAFEPQDMHARTLRESVTARARGDVPVQVVQALVGREASDGMTTLDVLPVGDKEHTLIKIDVEGAEMDVVAGAQSWVKPTNLFVIEVHRQEYLESLKKKFAAEGHELRQVDQQPLPILGREMRDTANWWLVSASVPMA
jgi:hypothetical protein